MRDEQSHFWARLWEVTDFLEKMVEEFELTFVSSEIIKKFPTIQWVYMHEIVINLYKILGDGKNDRYKLSNIERLFKDEVLKRKSMDLLNNHSMLIEKIRKNRNWISAHIDPRLVELKFSDDFVNKFEKKYDMLASNLRTESGETERYTPNDMKIDLLEIKQILSDVKVIWNLIITAE